ncbi:MAG: hypothetical protein KIT84_14460 [Labilithrix sp.]|nr:hypothetical protein [Labilithrix sp.]MCW5812224.1 hypothetical protein [Labilithrix sp.]
MNAKKNALIAAAAAGILGGLVACGGGDKPANAPEGTGDGAGATTTPSTTEGAPADAAKHACKGQNECKGQGGCKTDTNACKGQNECKGKGGCKTA